MPDTLEIDVDAPPAAVVAAAGRTNAEQIRSYVDRLLSAKARIKDEQENFAAVLAAAVADGYDKKVLQELLKRLQADEQAVRTHDELLELYEAAYRNARDAA